MPVDNKEFENGDPRGKMAEEIIAFLKERKEGAFTSQEIMGGLHYHTDFSTLEVAKMSTFAIADFTALLHDLVKEEKIKMKIIRGRMYFTMGADIVAKCPKCGDRIAAKKTWKMAGRPDKKGKRLQLHIALFKCPKHGNFRTVLEKRKI